MIIRYLFSIGLALGCMGFPLQAKDKSSDSSTTKTAKTDSKQAAYSKATASTVSPHSSKGHSNSTVTGGSSSRGGNSISGRLARLTAYWAGEGDYYTGKAMSSTGVRLHGGHCAVDPRIIPYGSIVEIAGIGKYLAVDTGSAVISREAARQAARTAAERSALVVDIYFESRRDGQRFAANAPKYAAISWTTPSGKFLADDGAKSHNKQL